MRILFLAAEAVPIVKVGGLGDVAGGLPKALSALGHEVRVALPDVVALEERGLASKRIAAFDLRTGDGSELCEAYQVEAEGSTFQLVGGRLIRRDGKVYGRGVEEDGPKFAFFSRAALELCRELDWKPDLVHANDSHAAPAAAWLATAGARDPFFRDTASLLTIHNLPYMGIGAGDALARFGIPTDGPRIPDWARGAMLAVGIAHADEVNTVSPTYAREILTPEYGCGLEDLLSSRRDRLSGILNGIDVATWDPSTDPAIPHRFDMKNSETRAPNKLALRRELGLDATGSPPLLGAVSRLDHQKGFDVASLAIAEWLSSGGQFVLLGSGDPAIEAGLALLASEFPGRASIQLRFDPALARRVYAGSDAFLIPSRYEPCGLTQMIAMRYGSVPVARATGGLVDTIRDADLSGGTGVLFRELNPDSIAAALARARGLLSRPEAWSTLVRNGMSRDFSWREPAKLYSQLYERALSRKRSAEVAATSRVDGP